MYHHPTAAVDGHEVQPCTHPIVIVLAAVAIATTHGQARRVAIRPPRRGGLQLVHASRRWYRRCEGGRRGGEVDQLEAGPRLVVDRTLARADDGDTIDGYRPFRIVLDLNAIGRRVDNLNGFEPTADLVLALDVDAAV